MATYVPDAKQDQQLEMAMGTLLRIGVMLSAAIVLLGGVLYLRHLHAPVPDYKTFHATGGAPRSLPGIFRELTTGKSESIIQLGILVLIATPVARVIFALVGFARERDWLYSVVSALVLAILIFSLLHTR